MSVDTLRRERDRFVAFAFAAADMLVELDKDGIVRFADGAIGGLLGISPQSLVGKPFSDILVEADHPVARNLLDSIVKQQRMENIPLTFFSQAFNTPIDMDASAFYFGQADKHVFLSISARKNSAANDDLRLRNARTGTLNKESFAEQANERILEAQKLGQDLELTLLDLPHLQEALQGLNPKQARSLLSEIGEYIRSKSVGGDMAATLDEGSSFSLLHGPGVSASEIVSAIRGMVGNLLPKLGGMEVTSRTVRAKATGLTKQDSANALLFTLNKFAESHGEDFSIDSIGDGYTVMLEETMQRIGNFRDVLNEEHFNIAFQPIVDIKSGIVHHYECLVRLNEEASKNFDNPFSFISFGESAGLINEFDLLMTKRTLDILSEAKKNKQKPIVSVNVSGRSLSSSLFMDSFHKMVSDHADIRKQLILEITESAKIADLKLANAFIQKLRREGNLVCLDDFGSGESSFDYLRSLQVDFIKIDGSYVKESMVSQHGRDMLRAMAGLCRALNIVTIGEMVEDEKAAAFLSESGITFGQGYYFGKPDVSVEVLKNCKKELSNYPTIFRARRF